VDCTILQATAASVDDYDFGKVSGCFSILHTNPNAQ